MSVRLLYICLFPYTFLISLYTKPRTAYALKSVRQQVVFCSEHQTLPGQLQLYYGPCTETRMRVLSLTRHTDAQKTRPDPSLMQISCRPNTRPAVISRITSPQIKLYLQRNWTRPDRRVDPTREQFCASVN